MAEYETLDLDPKHRETVVEILREHVPGCEVRAYGSRVKWRARQHSDLDLAIIGADNVAPIALFELREALEESDLPFRVDVMDWNAIPEYFHDEIQRRHVVLQSPAPDDQWNTMTLGEFAPLSYGKSLPKRDRDSNGSVDVYDSNGIVGIHTEACTSGPTIIVGRKGTVGAVNFSPDPCWPIDTTFYHEDADINLAQFKFYALRALGLPEMNSDSAVPGLNRDAAHAVSVKVPSEGEQRSIASVLSAFDDRIELNRRMCETLEEMAQALFKSWFVDFDPVRAKMDGRWHKGESLPGLPAHLYDYFPDDLVDSELGLIPAGWCIGPLSEAIEVNPNTKSDQSEQHRYVAMASIPTDGPFVRERVYRDKATGCRYRNGDALVARITPCLENGKTAYVDFLDHDEVGCGSTELLVLRARAPWPPESSYLLARQQHFRDYAVANMVGSSGRQRVSAEVIGQFRTVLPPDGLMSAVASTLTSVFRRGSEAAFQSVRLQDLREALLPKLISGEVRLPETLHAVEC